MTVMPVILETILFHPNTQQQYSQLTCGQDFYYGKQVVRLIADLLQFGPLYLHSMGFKGNGIYTR